MAAAPLVINKPVLLLVEGDDEKRFFGALISKRCAYDTIQIVDYSGKDNLRSMLAAYQLAPGFESISAIGIVRDADDNHVSAWQSIISTLNTLSLTQPDAPESLKKGNPSVNVFISPGSNRNGKLETLCLEAITGDPLMSCVHKFKKCIEENASHSDWEKFQLQAFIAATPKPSIRLLGEAAYGGYLKLESEVYESLVLFISSLHNCVQ